MPSLVDYFVVCGLKYDLEKEIAKGASFSICPLSRSFSCKVLARFPEKQLSWNPFDQSAVTTLCMPDGLLFKKNLKNTAKTTFHTFLITRENGTLSYGNVLTFYEQIKEMKILNILDSLQQKYVEKSRITLDSDKKFSFSRDVDTLYAPKCLCLLTSEQLHRPFETYLNQIYSVSVGNKHMADLPVESYLYNILYEAPLPVPGKSVKLSGPLGKLTFRRPSLNEFPVCDYSFKVLFKLLGPRNIIKLLTCILLEHQVLVKSSDYEQLMLVCHCSTSLLFPFSWPHVFVPFLPTSQRGFLDAPVPYIMGLRVDQSSSESRSLNLPSVASLCTVDTDMGIVECPDELPALPDEDRLILKVSEMLQQHNVIAPDLPAFPPSPELTPHNPSIIEALRVVEKLTDNSHKNDFKKILTDAAENNPHIPNLISIATRTGIETPLSPTLSLDEGTYDLDNESENTPEEPLKNEEWNYVPDQSELKFAMSVRDVFANYFVEHFANYENFIIVPKQSYDQWQKNREQFQNFDRTAFISDQPAQYREFYSAFVESSMFTSFIDEKIVTFWEPEKAGPKLSLFESFVEQYRDKTGLAQPPSTPVSGVHDIDSDSPLEINDLIDEIAPLPHHLSKEGSTVVSAHSNPHTVTSSFPTLDSSLLKMTTTAGKGSLSERCLSPSLSTMKSNGLSIREGLLDSNRQAESSPSPVKRRFRPGGGSGGSLFSSHSHVKFVSQLMRESRLRVKHMLGINDENDNVIEENTHIAYLCDLLERIWGHGLKKRDSKSPLWAHLMAYAEIVGDQDFSVPRGTSPQTYSPSITASLSSLAIQNASPVSSGVPSGDVSPRTTQTLRAHFRRRNFQSPILRGRVESILQPPPSTLVADLRIVHNMRELKTDVGRARAWVRLALENKSLSRHLSHLLSHRDLINRRYREYAFIGTDEEREQFLYHLLTLTARDFSCFTTGFLSTSMTYRILVVGEGKHFGLSTACLYVNLAGEVGDTGTTEIPRGEYQTEITCVNLGPLTCLRIGHDNSGITPSLFVEMILVHNRTTGQTYRFNCSHWFARSEEDGSIERFLTAQKVPQTLAKSGTMSALNVDSVLPPSPSRRRSNKKETEDKASVNDLKLDLKIVMDKLRTDALNKGKFSKQEVLQLIHGPNGFLECMEQVLCHGFRYTRKFQRRLYVWDLLERVQEQLSNEADPPTAFATSSPDPETHCMHMFINAVSRINSNNPNIGKDEKAMRFFCFGLRDHYLPRWIALIAQSTVSQSLYEPHSFIRDPELLQNLLDALTLTFSLPIKLDPLFTQAL